MKSASGAGVLKSVAAGKNGADEMEPAGGKMKSGRLAAPVTKLCGLGEVDAKRVGERTERGREGVIQSGDKVATLGTVTAGANGPLGEALPSSLSVMLNQPSSDVRFHLARSIAERPQAQRLRRAAQPVRKGGCGWSAGGSTGCDARSSSLQRMVRRHWIAVTAVQSLEGAHRQNLSKAWEQACRR